MPEEESNLSFAEFGVGVNEKRVAIGAPKRPYTAPAVSDTAPNENTPGRSDRGHWEKMERETGLEPATLSLGS